jgi:hypothetical protein
VLPFGEEALEVKQEQLRWVVRRSAGAQLAVSAPMEWGMWALGAKESGQWVLEGKEEAPLEYLQAPQ